MVAPDVTPVVVAPMGGTPVGLLEPVGVALVEVGPIIGLAPIGVAPA